MSAFAAIFTITTVVVFVLVLTIAVCLGVVWLWRKAFGPHPDDQP